MHPIFMHHKQTKGNRDGLPRLPDDFLVSLGWLLTRLWHGRSSLARKCWAWVGRSGSKPEVPFWGFWWFASVFNGFWTIRYLFLGGLPSLRSSLKAFRRFTRGISSYFLYSSPSHPVNATFFELVPRVSRLNELPWSCSSKSWEEEETLTQTS